MKGIGLRMGNGIFPPFIRELYVSSLPSTCTPTHMYTHTHTQQGYTALIAAAESQHEDIVELLIEVHADPDLQDEVIGIMFPWIQHMESP